MRYDSRGFATLMVVTCCLLQALTSDAIAQTSSSSPSDRIAFDRPEAWAMKYFTSATSLSGLATPDRLSPGSVAIQFEGGWLPALSASQELVGFNGTAHEDLNMAPVFLRPRVAIGLPHSLMLIVAVDPPIRTFGVTPRLLAFGLEGIIHDAGPWSFGWRAHGQIGTVTAAFTCPANVVSFPPGSPNNPTGCTAESSDSTSLRYAGIEFHAARRIGQRLVPHAAAGANVVDNVFQTNALTFGQPDHTRLQSAGATFSMSAGVGYMVTERLTLSADVFYAPLTVRRTAESATSIDSMFNVRALFSYRVTR
jgi:hypothetical protein